MANKEISNLHKKIINLTTENKLLNDQLSKCHELILNAYVADNRLQSFTLSQVLDLNNEITRGVYFYPILKECGISDEAIKETISKRWHEEINKRKDIEYGNMGTD